MAFKKARRGSVPVKLLLSAPSGWGKTYQALQCAKAWCKGNWDEVYFVDTENSAGKLYAERFCEEGNEFNHDEITYPITPQKVAESIHTAVSAGAKTIILDSYTPAYEYLANRMQILQKGETLAKGNMTWGDFNKHHEPILDAIKYCSANIIVTCRQKYDVINVDSNGMYSKSGKIRKRLPKIGAKLIGHDSLEYEMTVHLQLDDHHQMCAVKDRTGVLPTNFTKFDESHFMQILNFCNRGELIQHPDLIRFRELCANPKMESIVASASEQFAKTELGSEAMQQLFVRLQSYIDKQPND